MLKLKQILTATAALFMLAATPAAQAQEQKRTEKTSQDVNVVNTQAQPVPVRDVEKQRRETFSRSLSSFAEPGSATGNLSTFTVPDGKRLVIEDVSMEVGLPVGQRALVILDVLHPPPLGSRTSRPVTLNFQLTTIQATDIYVAGEPVRMTLEPGERLQLFFLRSATTPSNSGALATAYVQGYLVDVPQQ